MASIHIIVLFIASIFLFTLYFVLKVHLKSSVLSIEDDFITVFYKKIEKHIQETAENFKLEWYFGLLIVSPIVLGITIYILGQSGAMAVLVGCFALFVPEGIIQLIKADNQKKFEERYARSLEQLSSSLRAGLSISQAVEDVANCKFLHESMRKRYAKMSSDLEMGLTISETFRRFAEEVHSEDADDIALAIDVQSEVGGHEADVVKEIADNINQRMMLRREVKSLFAETSSMVWIMDILVPLVIIGYSVSNPSYVELYFSSPTFIVAFLILIGIPLIGSLSNHHKVKNITKGV